MARVAGININKPVIAMLALVALVVVLLVMAVNLPIRLVAGKALESIDYTDLSGASLRKGDLWVRLDSAPGLVHVVYRWCPALSPLRWCMDLQHPAFAIEGQVSLSLSQLVSISDLEIHSMDIAALGLGAGLVDARIDGRIDSMAFHISTCPLRQLDHLQGNFSTQSIRFFGASAGAHQLQIATEGSNINADISGETFSGRVQLANGSYSARGEMIAPDSIAAMAQSLMRPLGGNRFGWEIKGELSC